MKRNHERNKIIDWRYCFICQNKKIPTDNTTDDGLRTLCANITEIWKLGEMDLELDSMINETVDGISDLYGSIKDKAKFHQKCKNKYDKQKIQRILKKKEKQNQESEPAEKRVTRNTYEKHEFGSLFCAICGEKDIVTNLHEAGTFHASDTAVDKSHNNAFTAQWKTMALKLNKVRLLNLLSSGDIACNELWYHNDCNVNLWNEYNEIDAKKRRSDIDWKKAKAFHSVVTHVIEKVADDPDVSLPVKELNILYTENLKELGIVEQCQATRFADRLIKSIPNLVSTIVNNKLYVLRSEKVEELVSSHVKCPETYLASLQAVVHPIRVAIDKLENTFTGHFDDSSQTESVPKLLLLLMMLLIHGSTSMKPSQAALSAAQMITYHARNSRRICKKQRHRKQQETPLMIYAS